MMCRTCNMPMHKGRINGGVEQMVCLNGHTVCLPMGGPTNQHSLDSRSRTVATESEGEELFARLWSQAFPHVAFEREYKFHPFREWRLDFAWPECRFALEIESSVHRTKGRYAGDMEKHNALTMEGWNYLRVTRAQLESEPVRFLNFLSAELSKATFRIAKEQGLLDLGECGMM